MRPIAETKTRGFALLAANHVLPSAQPGASQAPEEQLLASWTTALGTYRTLSREFDRGTANLGASAAAAVEVPSEWNYFFRMWGGASAVGAAVCLAGSAFFGMPLKAAAGWAAGAVGATGVVTFAIGCAGVYTRWGTARRERVTAERLNEPLAAARLMFMKAQFGGAQAPERAFLGELAAAWLRDLDARQIIGKQSRDVLRDIVAETSKLEPELRKQSQILLRLVSTVYDAKGGLVESIDAHGARRILDAAADLTDEQHAQVLPHLRDLLFDGERPRIKMSFEACQALLEGLQPRAISD